MSWLIMIGFILGIVLGFVFSIPIPPIYARYLGIAILASMDSMVGGFRKYLENEFNEKVFISGFISNTVLAIFITFLGDRIGVDLILAAIVAFGVRLFNNFSAVRHYIFQSKHWE